MISQLHGNHHRLSKQIRTESHLFYAVSGTITTSLNVHVGLLFSVIGNYNNYVYFFSFVLILDSIFLQFTEVENTQIANCSIKSLSFDL